MDSHNEFGEVEVKKNSEIEGPVPSVWRPRLAAIVDAFARQDYRLVAGIPGVAPVPEKTAEKIRAYIQRYGATLTVLSKETWDTSVYIWMGDHWDAMIDLWTAEEGKSDLVLQVHIVESSDGYFVKLYMVYVP